MQTTMSAPVKGMRSIWYYVCNVSLPITLVRVIYQMARIKCVYVLKMIRL